MGLLHLVLVSSGVDPAAIKQVCEDLQDARAAREIDFVRVSLGSTVARHVRDGVLGGRIDTGASEIRAVLCVEVADEDALDAYYEAPVHSIIRRKFLCSISEPIAELYKRAQDEPDNAHLIYDEIERYAANYIERLDLKAG